MATLMLNEQMSSVHNDTHVKFLEVWEPWLFCAFPKLNKNDRNRKLLLILLTLADFKMFESMIYLLNG